MTTTSSKTVAIFGATGAQGAPVVKEALAKGHTVRAIARDAAKVAAAHPGAIAQLDGDAMTVDTGALEATFNVKLTPVADHIKSWF